MGFFFLYIKEENKNAKVFTSFSRLRISLNCICLASDPNLGPHNSCSLGFSEHICLYSSVPTLRGLHSESSPAFLAETPRSSIIVTVLVHYKSSVTMSSPRMRSEDHFRCVLHHAHAKSFLGKGISFYVQHYFLSHPWRSSINSYSQMDTGISLVAL